MTDISKVNYISQGTFDTKTQVDNELDFVNMGGSLSMPSTTKTPITAGASGTSYVAPSAGYFSVTGTTTTVNAYLTSEVSGGQPYQVLAGFPSGYAMALLVPVNKGATCVFGYGDLSNVTITFFYAVGSESEA